VFCRSESHRLSCPSRRFRPYQRRLDIFEQAVGPNHLAFTGDNLVDVLVAEFFSMETES
jgi:hypothetical protein